jgi:hypothetical protein
MAAMKRLALVAFAAALLAPATANAAVPCRDRIYNDWYKDGKISSTYSIGCYRDALKHVPADARTYSSLADDIRSAEQGALERLHGKKNVPAQIGKGGTGAVSPATATLPRNGSGNGKGNGNGDVGKGPDGTGQVTDTTQGGTVAAPTSSSSGGGIPLPILILGGIALALVAIGAIGVGARRFRRQG